MRCTAVYGTITRNLSITDLTLSMHDPDSHPTLTKANKELAEQVTALKEKLDCSESECAKSRDSDGVNIRVQLEEDPDPDPDLEPDPDPHPYPHPYSYAYPYPDNTATSKGTSPECRATCAEQRG